MNFTPPYPDRLPDPDGLGFVKAVESYLGRLRAFYNSRAIWHRRFYRYSGILLISIGAALPVITNFDFDLKDLIIAVLGAVVAIITAVRTFYRWDKSWILLRNTEITITKAWWAYCAEIDEVAGGTDEAMLEQRRAAARKLITKLIEIRDQESQLFFKEIQGDGNGG